MFFVRYRNESLIDGSVEGQEDAKRNDGVEEEMEPHHINLNMHFAFPSSSCPSYIYIKKKEVGLFIKYMSNL